MNELLQTVRDSLINALQLPANRLPIEREVRLMGSIPEFDSMAVLAVLTELEDALDIEFEDDEISAEIFETLGSISDFVSAKLATQ